jgi:AraC-like DNA-binding protein
MGDSFVVEPERARRPPFGRSPHPELQRLLARPHTGFTDAPRHRLVVAATAAVPVVVRIQDPEDRAPAFVLGTHGKYTVMDSICAPTYLEMDLAPLGAYTLLGLAMDEINGLNVDLNDLLGADGRRLADQLRDAANWSDRFALVDAALLRRLETVPQPSPEVGRAWQLLVVTAGAMPISRIARDVRWSHKHLITKFKEQIGLAPKTAARLVRFDTVWRRIDERPKRWERIAADAGYADQAHFIRDFREFTGTTPSAYLAEVNSVQDAVAAAS